MAQPRFLVAKYVPDLRRMEPRNIGVVVWAEGAVSARFVGENGSGVDGIQSPRHLAVRSGNAYRQWVGYWRRQLSKESLTLNDGRRITRDDPDFVDALRGKSKHQYMLVDGGFLMGGVSPNDVDEVASDLYAELVDVPKVRRSREEQRHATQQLYRSCEYAFRESGIAQRRDFWTNYDTFCPVGDTKQHFRFDYAIHATIPSVVWMRVLLWRLQSVHSTAFRFNCMRAAYQWPKERCAALVYATEDDIAESDDVREAWRMMNTIGTVVNMTDPDRAASQLLTLVA